MAEQRSFVDYRQGGDSGNDNVDAIQPIADGEAATSTVFRRPPENIRGRTEVVRDSLRELLHHRDFSDLKLSQPSGSTVAWGGSTTDAGTGIVTQTGAITIRPMLSPTASKKGVLAVGTVGVNRVTYTVSATGYATQGLDQVTVEHRDGGAATALAVSISDGPIKRILVVFDSTNATHTAAAVIAALTPVIAGDTVLASKITLTDGGVAGNAVAALAETHVEGTVDQQAHVLATGLLTAYTTSNPLAEGDCVAIWYRYLIEFPETGVAGGKWESNPDRATSNIPIGSLFVTNDSPEKIPGALPICKVIEGELVFLDGSRFAAGATGALGSVDAGVVTVNPLVFTGVDTASLNGGISSTLTPETVLAALMDVDLRLRNRRMFTFTCTDGSTSTGGSFNSATAIQDAITALGGTRGSIYVRRGTYTLPDTYVIPTGVSLIGEDMNLVTLTQAAPTSLTNTGLNRLENLTLDVPGIVVSMGSASVVQRVTVDGRVQFQNTNEVLNFTVLNSGFTTAESMTVVGSLNKFSNLGVVGSLTCSGDNNTLDNIQSIVMGVIPANSICRVNGSYNVLRNFKCNSLTVDLTVGKGILDIEGSFNTVEVAEINSTSSSVTDGRYGVIAAGDSITLNNVHCTMSNGTALYLIGSGLSLTANNCIFKNDSSANDTVVDASLTQPLQLQFNNCVFDQTEETGHPLWNMFASVTGALVDETVQFTNCLFYAARLNNYAMTGRLSAFYNCQFIIKNPSIAGFRPLGGVGDGQSTELFIFENQCTLRDCIINGYDSEVTNFGGNPTIQAPLFLKLTDSRAYNLALVNLNQQARATTVFYGLINLGTRGEIDGLRIEHTSTVSGQGGSPRLEAVVNLSGSDAALKNFTSNLLNWPGTVKPSVVHQLTTAVRFTMDTIRVQSDCKSFFSSEGVVELSWSCFNNIVLGTSTTGVTNLNGVIFPRGESNTYSNSFFNLNNAVAAGFMYLAGAQSGHVFNALNFNMINAVNNVNGVVIGTTNTVYRLKFTGCQWYGVATGAITKAFSSDITFSAVAGEITVGAGNVWTYVGGTAGAPSFAANINTW